MQSIRVEFILILISFLLRKIYTDNFTAEERCFENLGCFSTGSPFYHPKFRSYSFLPFPPEIVPPSFFLFTRENLHQPDILGVNATLQDLSRTHFNRKRKTRFHIHGFLHHALSPWAVEIKDALLEIGDDNVILVDWTKGNRSPYAQAVANARVVGAMIAQFIKTLKIPPTSVHISGHSLGCHVAAYVGQRLTGLSRITALDPAHPYFTGMPPEVRLDPSDASFVDVIHSAGVSSGFGFGTMQRMGHMDFYPNGGERQPLCNHGLLDVRTSKTTGLADGGPCFHMRALDFYIESIRKQPCPFLAFRCSSWEDFRSGKCSNCSLDGGTCVPFGFHSESYRPQKNATESYYLVTAATKKNFCAFEYKLTFHFGTGFNATNGTITIKQGKQEFNMNDMLIKMEPEMKVVVVSGKGSPLSSAESLWLRWNTKNEQNGTENRTLDADVIALRSISLQLIDLGSGHSIQRFINKEINGLKSEEDYEFIKI